MDRASGLGMAVALLVCAVPAWGQVLQEIRPGDGAFVEWSTDQPLEAGSVWFSNATAEELTAAMGRPLQNRWALEVTVPLNPGTYVLELGGSDLSVPGLLPSQSAWRVAGLTPPALDARAGEVRLLVRTQTDATDEAEATETWTSADGVAWGRVAADDVAQLDDLVGRVAVREADGWTVSGVSTPGLPNQPATFLVLGQVVGAQDAATVVVRDAADTVVGQTEGITRDWSLVVPDADDARYTVEVTDGDRTVRRSALVDQRNAHVAFDLTATGRVELTAALRHRQQQRRRVVVSLVALDSPSAEAVEASGDAQTPIVVDALRPGAYAMTTSAAGFEAVTQTVLVGTAVVAPYVELLPAAPAPLELVILTSDGRPAGDARVTLRGRDGRAGLVIGPLLAEVDGTLRVADLPAGWWDLEVVLATERAVLTNVEVTVATQLTVGLVSSQEAPGVTRETGCAAAGSTNPPWWALPLLGVLRRRRRGLDC